MRFLLYPNPASPEARSLSAALAQRLLTEGQQVCVDYLALLQRARTVLPDFTLIVGSVLSDIKLEPAAR